MRLGGTQSEEDWPGNGTTKQCFTLMILRVANIVDRNEKKDYSLEDSLVPTVIHQNSIATSNFLLYPVLSLM